MTAGSTVSFVCLVGKRFTQRIGDMTKPSSVVSKLGHLVSLVRVPVFLAMLHYATVAMAIDISELGSTTVISEGEGKYFYVEDGGHAYVNGTHYVVWSDGMHNVTVPNQAYDGYVKLSISTNNKDWQTTNVAETEYGSQVHLIAVDDNGSVHIVYMEATGQGTYDWCCSVKDWDLVHLTNASGTWERITLESTESYRSFRPAALFFTPDGTLNLFYNQSGWFRYNAPLYERNFDGSSWSEKKLVSDLHLGRDDPDNFENFLYGWDIEEGKKVLYVGSGYYHEYYHGPAVYTDKVYRLREDPASPTGYASELQALESPHFRYDNGHVAFLGKDFKSVHLDESLLFELDAQNDDRFYRVSYDQLNGILVASAIVDGKRRAFIFNNDGLDHIVDDSFAQVSDGLLLFSRNWTTPQAFAVNIAAVDVFAENVSIDIKSGNKRNIINSRSKGGIWVAVLSNTDPESPFDPSSQVDIPTVAFGPDGAKAIRSKVKDINGDGLGDLLLRFKIPETGIACTDTEATLTGETFEGQSLTGTDSIKIARCESKKHCKKHHYEYYDKKYYKKHHEDDR
jgi:hypothetical protein